MRASSLPKLIFFQFSRVKFNVKTVRWKFHAWFMIELKFVDWLYWKEIRPGCPLLFLKKPTKTNFTWCLVFSHWFLVNSLSNGKDINNIKLSKLFGVFRFFISWTFAQFHYIFWSQKSFPLETLLTKNQWLKTKYQL